MDEPTRVFVLRHGQTAWNASRRIQGHVDEPLDDTGRWQAQRLAQALAGEGIAAIYSSDLQRARYTVALAAVDQRTFSVTAVPKGVQATADSACATLSISQTGAKGVSGTGTVAACWR